MAGHARPARLLWLAAVLFFVWVAVGVGVGASRTHGYATHTHLVTAAKFAEYALLAPALPLLTRTVRELAVALWSLAVWSSLATIVGVAQFFGAAIFLSGTVGRRQASFLSSADFAALSGAALLVGAVALAFPRTGLSRRLGWFSVVTGALGMIVASLLLGPKPVWVLFGFETVIAVAAPMGVLFALGRFQDGRLLDLCMRDGIDGA